MTLSLPVYLYLAIFAISPRLLLMIIYLAAMAISLYKKFRLLMISRPHHILYDYHIYFIRYALITAPATYAFYRAKY